MLHALGLVISRRARWFLLAWGLLTVVGFLAVGGRLGTEGLFDRLRSEDAPQVAGEAKTGLDLLAAASPAGTSVQLLLDGVDPASRATYDAVVAAASDVRRLDHVAAIAHPYLGPQGQVLPAAAIPQAVAASPFVGLDRRSVLVVVTLDAGLTTAQDTSAVATVDARLQRTADTLPGATARVGGQRALIDEINGHVRSDLAQGEAVALPLSLVVMIVVFGGLLAAGLPIVGAIASIAGGLLTLLGFSHVVDLTSTVPSVVSVLGLGLCIDYGLLLVSRYREELRRLHDDGDETPSREALEGALEHTLGTAGRTVLFSGVTVAVSLSGLMLFRASILRAVGAAGVSVVVVAVLVALTLVPALLALAGDRLLRPGVTVRIPGLRRYARRLGDVAPAEGTFSRLARRVQRRPVLVVLGVLAVLLAAGAPVLTLRVIGTGLELLPTSSVQRQQAERVGTQFPQLAEPAARVVSRAPVADLSAWGRQVAPLLPAGSAVGAATEEGTGADRVSVLPIRSSAPTASQARDQLVRTLRSHRPSFQVWVTGFPALNVEFVDELRARAPLSASVVVVATFVLLFLMTGSVLVPLKALAMNVVSLGASFGVLVWIFQEGHLESVLGFTSAGGIDRAIPALVLAFAFGLSMDYEVFLLSRIKENRDAGATNDEAVVRGLQQSGRIITSAALVVVIVFIGFAGGQLLVIKQMGVALAVAVAVDATLVRMLLVPATMTLLGEWNWWAPGPLRRLHDRFGLREQ